MNIVDIQSITQQHYDLAERMVISYLRRLYPSLDLRKGTVLRSLLISPNAVITAANMLNIEQLRSEMSIKSILENYGDSNLIDKILSNFNIKRNVGKSSTGEILVVVDLDKTYIFNEGFRFLTLNGLSFVVNKNVTVKRNAVSSLNEIELTDNRDGTYKFILPVVSEYFGVENNIIQGTALVPENNFYGFISASAYKDFYGASSSEDAAHILSRLPAALSNRSFTSKFAIESKLYQDFQDTDVKIEAISVQGYGSPTQIRDSHNVFGISSGGKTDLYVRTFYSAPIVTIEKTGNRIAENTYEFEISAADAYGFYAIKSITDAGEYALSSYLFSEKRSYDDSVVLLNDIKTDSVSEVAFSVYQKSKVTVYNVPSNVNNKKFRVDLYSAPHIKTIHDYVNRDNIKNVSADILIRSPLMCLVSCLIEIHVPRNSDNIDFENLSFVISNYINSRSFVPRLTRSELTAVAMSYGINSVNLDNNGFILNGKILGADGNWVSLSGDSLDIDTVENKKALISSQTCVFVSEPNGISIRGIFK